METSFRIPEGAVGVPETTNGEEDSRCEAEVEHTFVKRTSKRIVGISAGTDGQEDSGCEEEVDHACLEG
jgi:hypothetical protein